MSSLPLWIAIIVSAAASALIALAAVVGGLSRARRGDPRKIGRASESDILRWLKRPIRGRRSRRPGPTARPPGPARWPAMHDQDGGASAEIPRPAREAPPRRDEAEIARELRRLLGLLRARRVADPAPDDDADPPPGEPRDADNEPERIRLIARDLAMTSPGDRAIEHKYLGGLIGLGAREYRVWFGTNRKPADAKDPARGFSGARDAVTHYGHCDVVVPKSHRTGSIGSSWLRRLMIRADDRLRVTRTIVLDQGDYWRAIAEQLAAKAPGARHAIVFIHGYNVTFEQSAIRAAQIGFDLGVDGAMGFFSWPSHGSAGHYLADGAAIEASEPAIADFLADFGAGAGADFVHVIAHSMGNRGLLRAVNRILADAGRRTGCRFGQFILAAPDVDADTFRALAGAFRQLARRTTLYVSARDRAVALSQWIHDYPRVGFEPPISLFDGIDTISVANVDLTMLGHGYVGAARPVLADMHNLIFHGDPPEARFTLEPRRAEGGGRYWAIRG